MIDQHPLYTPAEARSRETFLALMWALSYPGRVYTLMTSAPPFALIGETLLDLETTFFTPDASLAETLATNGARSLPPESAAYHFYPYLSPDNLDTIADAGIGTLLYPDRAATLFIGCEFGRGETLELVGPGVNSSISIEVDLPSLFWDVRESRRRYPLGYDIYLIDDVRVMGIPRSTSITRQRGA